MNKVDQTKPRLCTYNLDLHRRGFAIDVTHRHSLGKNVCLSISLDWSSWYILPLKEWENPSETAAWRAGGPGPSPYKDGFAPMNQIPGCHAPKYIMLDYCHIYHLGYGMDAAASSIALLCELGHFGTMRKLDDKLEEAYKRFDQWCKVNRRTTALDEFSKQGFGMGGFPGYQPKLFDIYVHL